MKLETFPYLYFRKPIRLLILLLVLTASLSVNAQEKPPRPITIYINPVDGLKFGAFSHGIAGGSVTVEPTGLRTPMGSIYLLGQGINSSPAIFYVEGLQGTVVSIVNGPDAVLTGSNGGSMTMKIGASSVVSPFIINTSSPDRMEIRIGGTLYVGNSGANPPGTYNGTFVVTFIQE